MLRCHLTPLIPNSKQCMKERKLYLTPNSFLNKSLLSKVLHMPFFPFHWPLLAYPRPSPHYCLCPWITHSIYAYKFFTYSLPTHPFFPLRFIRQWHSWNTQDFILLCEAHMLIRDTYFSHSIYNWNNDSKLSWQYWQTMQLEPWTANCWILNSASSNMEPKKKKFPIVVYIILSSVSSTEQVSNFVEWKNQ